MSNQAKLERNKRPSRQLGHLNNKKDSILARKPVT